MLRDRIKFLLQTNRLPFWLALSGATLTLLLVALPGCRWAAVAVAALCLGAFALPVSLTPGMKSPCRPGLSPVLCYVVAAVVGLFTLWQAGSWLFAGQPVPPESASLTPMGVFNQALQLLFGGLAAGFLALCGRYFATGEPLDSRLAPLALAPVAWQWVRLLRYEMSYAGAGPLANTLLVTAVLVSALLFWYLLVVGVTGSRPLARWRLLLAAGATALFGLSVPLYLWVGGLAGLPGCPAGHPVVGLPDVAVGGLALALVYTLSVPSAGSVSSPAAASSAEGESQQ